MKCVRGWKAVFKIKAAFKSIDINPELSLNMFDTLVKPIVCYSSEIWGAMNTLYCSTSKTKLWEKTEKLPVEIFHLKYCKGLLGVHKKSQNSAVMGELGRLWYHSGSENFVINFYPIVVLFLISIASK